MKNKTFYIHYRYKNSVIYNGLQKFAAKTLEDAIQMSKEIFIETWNFAFPHRADGDKEVNKLVFEEYKA